VRLQASAPDGASDVAREPACDIAALNPKNGGSPKDAGGHPHRITSEHDIALVLAGYSRISSAGARMSLDGQGRSTELKTRMLRRAAAPLGVEPSEGGPLVT
jgi:hypothetical protein